MPLVVLVIAWMLGLVVGEAWGVPLVPTLVLSGGSYGLAWLWRGTASGKLLVVIGTLLLGAARLGAAQPQTTDVSIWRYNGQRVMLSGTISDQPDRRDKTQKAVLQVETLQVRGGVRNVEGLVQLQLPPVPELRYGQRVRVVGVLAEPQSSDTFDYRTYLARHGIRAIMEQPQLTVLPGVGGSALLRPLLYLNDRCRTTALRLLPEPHASLLIGILLGVQSTIPQNVLNDFSATGTSHILVISGWNITVVIVGVLALLHALGLTRRRAAYAALGMVALYVLFVGGSPSVLRAALMGSLVVWAELAGRTSEPWTLLFAACGLLTVLDPFVLWDVGFQLSALATAGLFAFAGPLGTWLDRGPFRSSLLHWAVEPLTATLAASTLTLPILLYNFGRVSLIAPLANVLMLPAVPFAMAWGALATLAGLVSLPLGQGLGLLAWPWLQWLVLAAHGLARLPGATTLVPSFDIGWVWSYYGAVGGGWTWHTHGHALRTWLSQVPHSLLHGTPT